MSLSSGNYYIKLHSLIVLSLTVASTEPVEV